MYIINVQITPSRRRVPLVALLRALLQVRVTIDDKAVRHARHADALKPKRRTSSVVIC